MANANGKAKSNKNSATRKAIEGVDIEGTCKKIINPGPPLALPLQSHLLVGVTRVFSRKCDFILQDCERVKSQMRRVESSVAGYGDHLDMNLGGKR